MREIIRGALALLLLLCAAGSVVAQQSSGETSPRAELLRQFEGSMQKFEALAQAMPASTYGWSPAEGVMPVARVFAHVARYNYAYLSQNMGVVAPPGVDLDTLERGLGPFDVADRELQHRVLVVGLAALVLAAGPTGAARGRSRAAHRACSCAALRSGEL